MAGGPTKDNRPEGEREFLETLYDAQDRIIELVSACNSTPGWQAAIIPEERLRLDGAGKPYMVNFHSVEVWERKL